jgi:hypothetical protein
MQEDDKSLYRKLMTERYGDLFVDIKTQDVVDEESD